MMRSIWVDALYLKLGEFEMCLCYSRGLKFQTLFSEPTIDRKLGSGSLRLLSSIDFATRSKSVLQDVPKLIFAGLKG